MTDADRYPPRRGQHLIRRPRPGRGPSKRPTAARPTVARPTVARPVATTSAPTPSGSGATAYPAAARPPRRHRPGRRLRHRTVPAAAAAQGRPHRGHHRDRRRRADAAGGRRPHRRTRLAQRSPDRRPGRHRAHPAPLFTPPCSARYMTSTQCPAALGNVFDHLRPGAPVAAAGGKWPNPWMWPLRAWVTQLHAPFINDFTGFDQPWRLLARYVPDLQVRELAFGAGYLALGHADGAGYGCYRRRSIARPGRR